MGKSSRRKDHTKLVSKTLPSSPSHSFSSSSSSDFEFTISLSPLKSSSNLCPADELFYKGQLLPLHLSPRLSMVRTLLLSPNSSTRTSTDTASRDSTGSSNSSSNDSHSSFGCELLNDCDSSRPSSVGLEVEDEFKRLSSCREQHDHEIHSQSHQHQVKKPKYFSLSRFSSVFRKDQTKINKEVQEVVVAAQHSSTESASSVKKVSSSAKDVIRKYLKKVKPLYEKLSQKQQQEQKMDRIIKSTTRVISLSMKSGSLTESSVKSRDMSCISSSSSSVGNKENGTGIFSNSFSGNLRYPRKRSCISSCPSSIRTSPNHSGVLCGNKVINGNNNNSNNNVVIRSGFNSESSSMDELQNAIQGAIAHCKNSMARTKTEQTSLLTVN